VRSTGAWYIAATPSAANKPNNIQTGTKQTKTNPPPPLVYREARSFVDIQSALVDYLGTILFLTALLNPVTSKPIDLLRIIPEPGSIMRNISKQRMTNEFYSSVAVVGIGSKGTRMESILYVFRSGYSDTARMLIERNARFVWPWISMTMIYRSRVTGSGFYTPSIAFGNVLLNRLCKGGGSLSDAFGARGEKIIIILFGLFFRMPG